MQQFWERILATAAAAGFLVAAVAAILYFVELPIFDQLGLAWVFVTGLFSAAAAIFALFAKSIWIG